MSSKNAEKVARKVLENLGRGKKVNLGKIALESGYAVHTAENPKNITETKTYKDITEPVVIQLEKERQRIIIALSKSKLSKVKYRDLIDGLDKTTKNIQLLGGKATENLAIIDKVEIEIKK